MTYQAGIAKSGPYAANGVQDTFEYDFKIYAKTDLQAVSTVVATGIETIVDPAGYSVTGLGSDAGGNVVFLPIPANNTLITFRLLPAFEQQANLRNQGPYNPETVERMVDRSVMLAKSLEESDSRTIKLPVSSTQTADAYLAQIIASGSATAANAAAAAASAVSSSASAASAIAAAASAGSYYVGDAGGLVTAITFASGFNLANTVGYLFRGRVGASTNTGALTIKIDTGAALPLKKSNGSGGLVDVVAGDLPINGMIEFVNYNNVVYQLLTVRPNSHGADIVAAANVNLDTATGNYVVITGATTVTSITLAEGQHRLIRSAASFKLTNSASLININNKDVVTQAGDFIEFIGEAAGVVRMIDYATASTVASTTNKLINGALVFDQEKEYGSYAVPNTNVLTYASDGFTVACQASSTGMTAQNVANAPAGLVRSLKVTTGVGAAVAAGDFLLIQQKIEGYSVEDLGFGAAGAALVSLGFWVKSSITGTFHATLQNSAQTRAYIASFAITAANTWQYVEINGILGDTAGAWLGGTNVGLSLIIAIATGATFQNATLNSWLGANYYGGTGQTNTVLSTTGATFQVTGLQLNKGQQAAPLERLPFLAELQKVQRLYEKSYDFGGAVATATFAGSISYQPAGVSVAQTIQINAKRVAPTILFYSVSTGTVGKIYNSTGAADVNIAAANIGTKGFGVSFTSIANNVYNGQWVANARF